MIQRIQVQGYKSLKAVEVELAPLTVLIGPNAAGKSNLFDAIGLLSRLATARTLAEAFKEHRGDPIEAFFYEEGDLKKLLEQKQLEFRLEVDIQLEEGIVKQVEELLTQYKPEKSEPQIKERLLRYEVGIRFEPSAGLLRVSHEALRALGKDPHTQQLKPSRKRNAFLEPIEGKLRLRLEKQARPTEYDLGLPYTLLSQPLYPPPLPAPHSRTEGPNQLGRILL